VAGRRSAFAQFAEPVAASQSAKPAARLAADGTIKIHT
jgi:hypothetical protein